jgi:hypothetical protein
MACGKKNQLSPERQNYFEPIWEKIKLNYINRPDVDLQRKHRAFQVSSLFKTAIKEEGDYKDIFKKVGIINDVNDWLKKWNLDKKEWIYDQVGITLTQLDSFYPLYDKTFLPSAPFRFTDIDVLAPKPFKFRKWHVAIDESAEEYFAAMTNEFQEHLEIYINNCIRELKRKGYKQVRRPIDFDQIDWLIRWTVHFHRHCET